MPDRVSCHTAIELNIAPDIRSEFKGQCSRAYFRDANIRKIQVFGGCYSSFDKAFLFVPIKIKNINKQYFF